PISYRTWKDAKTMIVLGFQNGRLTRSYFTSSDPEVAEEMRKEQEAQRAQQPPPGGREPGRRGDDRQPPEIQSLDDNLRQARMTSLAGQLKTYAVTHQDRLPKDLAELRRWGNWNVFLPEVRQALETGEYVIAWSVKIDKFDSDTVIAWEKDAPDRGGFVGLSRGFAEKMTPAQIQAHWPKR